MQRGSKYNEDQNATRIKMQTDTFSGFPVKRHPINTKFAQFTAVYLCSKKNILGNDFHIAKKKKKLSKSPCELVGSPYLPFL